jgi:uncharacterized protein involved in exopolysaccharide biosynthesis
VGGALCAATDHAATEVAAEDSASHFQYFFSRQGDMDFVEREYTFWDLWTIFRKRKNLILLCTATAALGAFVFSFVLPKTFSATATLLISESRVADADTRMFSFVYYDLLRSYETFATNDYLIQKSIENFGLQNPPYKLSVDKFKRQRFLQIQLPKNTRLLNVSVEFPDARLAADIANFFAVNIISLDEEANAKDTQTTRLLIKKQLDRAAEELESSRQTLMEFSRNSKLEELREAVRDLLEEKSKNEADLSRLDSSWVHHTTKREWLLSQLNRQDTELNPRLNSDSAYPEARNTSTADKAKFPPTTPTKEEGAGLLHQQIQGQLLEADSEILGIKAEMQMLRKKFESIKQKLALLLPEKIAKEDAFDRLSLQAKLASDTYVSFNKKYQEAALNVGATTYLKLIAPALPPDRPIKPRIPLNVVLGACFGFLASTLLAFLLQNLDLAKPRSKRETLEDEKVREIKRSGTGL